MTRVQQRLQSLDEATPAAIRAAIASGLHPVLQFDRANLSPAEMKSIDALCSTHSADFGLRFFGFHKEPLDLRMLGKLPSVKCLYIDAERACNEQSLSSLARIERFHTIVSTGLDLGALHQQALAKIELLSLKNRTARPYALGALGRFGNLQAVELEGEFVGIDILGRIANLKRVALDYCKEKDLVFLNTLPHLQHLSMFLGARRDLDGVAAKRLESLDLRRVRSLQDLGDLSRFPRLKTLSIAEQAQLTQASFGPASSKLESLKLDNCKNLERIEGLHHLKSLRQIVIWRTDIDFERFMAQGLPPGLRTIVFRTGRKKIDEDISAKLGKLGFGGY